MDWLKQGKFLFSFCFHSYFYIKIKSEKASYDQEETISFFEMDQVKAPKFAVYCYCAR
jgi:hypothetical protein